MICIPDYRMDHPDIITKLAELLSRIVSGSAQSAEFLSIVEQVDALAVAGQRHLPTELRHFLGNRSYVKAANFIDKMDL